jgi:NitT/TauT family transport system substrate-binding protein
MSTTPTTWLRRGITAAALAPLLLAVAACGGADAATGDDPEDGQDAGAAAELRLGYFANVTHAAALIGVEQGFLAEELGDTELTTQVFNAGPDVVEAVFAGALDASYIGPSPTINAYGQSDGDAVRIIAGAASGGAQLVVREGIDSPEDLRGTTLATPQLGNTQDVALRTWLAEEGLESSIEGGGDVTVAPTPNADTLNLFRNGDLDGAWLPEPWASRLVLEAGAEVLVDERDLWPDGAFTTTHLIVRTEFLEEHPETVEALLRGHVAAVEFAGADADAAQESVNAGLEAAGSEALSEEVIDRAWEGLTVTYDPIPAALEESAKDGVDAGTSESLVDLAGIYDLRLLNTVLSEADLEPVSAGGLGEE